MKLNRVAVTGVSAICGLGNDLNSVWNNLISGVSGISSFDGELDPNFWPVTFAGIVRNFEISDELLSPKEKSRFDRFIHFALHGADEALKMSGFLEEKFDPYKVGSILGSGLGGFPFIESTHNTYLEKGARRVNPFFVPSFIPNMSSGMIAIKHNFKGINHAISSACASGAHAIHAAATEIMLGRQNMMVTGGSEAVLSGLTFAGFASMKALSKRNDDPTKASRPFDQDRDGFVMGEGAGILVLENLEMAQARGANILAELVGFGATDDAYHITSPEPEGEGTVPCMTSAIEMAGIKKEDIHYINAHGTSTPLGDLAETNAIKKVFGDHAYKLKVSSTKSMTGHLLGAAGGLETVFCVMALKNSLLPPTINLETPSVGCDLDYVPNLAQKVDIEYALNNSFGFGGTNASTILKKF